MKTSHSPSRSFCFLILLLNILPLHSVAQNYQEKIGQMIMVGFGTSQSAKDSLLFDIQNRNLGGTVLFAYNMNNPTQIKVLSAELQSNANFPLFISTDQEGGFVARLDEQNGYEATYSNFELGTEINDEAVTREQASIMAGWMAEAGINMNLAPVVDVNVNPEGIIGTRGRSFSEDENVVYQHASWFIEEFHEQNIVTSLKHFPGHGSAEGDTHQGFTDVTNSWQPRELAPFRLLIEDGYQDAIMTAHLTNNNWDNEYPASLSEYALKTILRDSLGFNGVVISDDLLMGAITDNFGFDEAVVQAINAGTDILLFTTNLYEGKSLAQHVISLVSTKLAEGVISEQTIDEAYARIMDLKKLRISTSREHFEPIAGKPEKIHISNYPNPFNPTTTVVVTLNSPGNVKMRITNSIGQIVQTFKPSRLSAGNHHFTFEANHLASGMYFIIVDAANYRQTHKMILLK